METTLVYKLPTFNTEIIAGSLLINESRKIAHLLLNNVDEQGWYQAIIAENILQKRSIEMAKRQATLIRHRLELMTPELWQMVEEGNLEITTQALLAAAIKHSRLIGDFLLRVLKYKFQVFENLISSKDWYNFLTESENLDSKIMKWTPATRKKLGSVVFSTLTEAKYLTGRYKKKISPIFLVKELRHNLEENNEIYILTCMEIH